MGGKGSGTVSADLMVLSGTNIIDDKLEKSDFFEFLKQDLADYSNVAMTPEQAVRFRNTVIRMKHGVSAAIPMYCTGTKCNNKLCVFHDTGKYPIGQPCLYETRLIQSLMKSYIEDLGVDPDSMSEMSLVNKLVECDLIDYRANIGLSGTHDPEAATLLKTDIFDDGQKTSETTKIHPLLEVKDKNHRIRDQILNSLAATRREKYKRAAALGKAEDSDASTFLSDLKKMFSEDSPKKSSLDKIKQDAKEVAEDFIVDADWEDGL